MQKHKASKADELSKKTAKRIKGAELVIPICYGTVAFWMGKKADEYRSHRWTVYIRSPDNDDISYFIKKVVFQLHASFAKPTRSVEAAPFQVTESGWGEFEIAITIHFSSDACEKPLELSHHLQLYPKEEGFTPNTKRPVVSEKYDELVFFEPSEAFYNRVMAHRAGLANTPRPAIPLPPPVTPGDDDGETTASNPPAVKAENPSEDNPSGAGEPLPPASSAAAGGAGPSETAGTDTDNAVKTEGGEASETKLAPTSSEPAQAPGGVDAAANAVNAGDGEGGAGAGGTSGGGAAGTTGAAAGGGAASVAAIKDPYAFALAAANTPGAKSEEAVACTPTMVALQPCFKSHDERAELDAFKEARQRVAEAVSKLEHQLADLEGEISRLRGMPAPVALV
eukprot:jgi/Mesvir1/16552/Mv10093-RA.1